MAINIFSIFYIYILYIFYIFVNISIILVGWAGGGGHLTIIGGGRAFDHHSRNGELGLCHKNCPQGWAFDQYFKMTGVCGGLPGRGCSRLELTRTLLSVKFHKFEE